MTTGPKVTGWAHVTACLPAVAVLLDFDGTLAEIVADPADAVAVPGALDALAALVGRVAVVGVVSGRPLAFLQAQVPVGGVERLGQYGAEREVDGRIVVDPALDVFRDRVEVAAIAAGARWPALRVERKGRVAVALHWREHPDAAPDAAAVDAFAAEFGLVASSGRAVMEFGLPGSPNKGDAVRSLLTAGAFGAAVFIGDDDGDVAAFDALTDWARTHQSRALRVAVRSPETPAGLLARADLVLDGPAAVVESLLGFGLSQA